MVRVVMGEAVDWAGEEEPRQREKRTAVPSESRRREAGFIERSGA
jgi:hypothetical protein